MSRTAYEAQRRAEEPWRRWYGLRRWRRKAEAQIKAEPLCRKCQARGHTTIATVADHIEPHKGDPEKFWNGELQSLCEFDHNSVKAAEEARGYVIGSDIKGRPLDPQHPWNRGARA